MKIAITGGTGFVGGHLGRSLAEHGHEVILLARGRDHRDGAIRSLPGVRLLCASTTETDRLVEAFQGCDAVVHSAGINRQIGSQTYQRVHVVGTRAVVDAAQRAGVCKIELMSFLRARPDCGSGYHESKWEAEEILRRSGLDYTILKAGVIYGRGDHMLDHLSRAFHSFPAFALVGLRDQAVRPVAVEDLVAILEAALVDPRLSRKTIPVLGPEELTLAEAVKRVSRAVGKDPVFFRAPVFFHYALGWVLERLMTTPLVSLAQVRILSEGITQPPFALDELPADLSPRIPFDAAQIRKGLPEPGGFRRTDLRCCASDAA
jgi:uncharacterized protein YbjT (DUF2867 family)